MTACKERTVEKMCCFTGHRSLGKDFSEDRAYRTIKKLREKYGVTVFFCGGAIGFDMKMGELVLKLKKEYDDIVLHMILPCRDQDARWGVLDKMRYKKLLKKADAVEYVQDYYSDGVMRVRNYRMVDRSEFCVCYFNGRRASGTAQTIRYAKKKGVMIGNLCDCGQDVIDEL